MIIDEILERKGGAAYTRNSLKYIYDEAMIFEFHDLARAIDSGKEEDIKRELCAYIDDNGYPKDIKDYVNGVEWLTDKEEEPEPPAKKEKAKKASSKRFSDNTFDCACLDGLMKAFSNSKGPMFKRRAYVNKDGSFSPFTKAGAVAYGRFTSFLYELARITGMTEEIEEIVEECDSICNEDIELIGPYK